jgi:DnaA family protein
VNQQLTLNIRPRAGATFAAFYPGPNQAAVHALAEEHGGACQVYLWGAPATGKSHLLQAVCHRMSELGRGSAYLPLARFEAADAAVLEDLSGISSVCVDDVDAVAGYPAWERGLFNLINGVRGAGHRLVLASHGSPANMIFDLPDLKSRLLWGAVFHLRALDDEAKLAALKARANQCGLELKDEAGRFLLNNCRRDLNALFGALARVDQASLAAQRRVTVPFIKSVLGL